MTSKRIPNSLANLVSWNTDYLDGMLAGDASQSEPPSQHLAHQNTNTIDWRDNKRGNRPGSSIGQGPQTRSLRMNSFVRGYSAT